MSSAVAITGAHGFIGSALRRNLVQRGNVLSLGRHESDVPWALEDPHAPNLDSAEGIVHCAWIVAPRTSATTTSNVAGSLALLDEARRLDIPFVFLSSMSASDTTRSRYGRAKRAVEKHVLAYRRGRVVRPGTVQDGAGGIGMLGASLGRLAGLPVRPMLSPSPKVPLVSLDRVVASVDAHLAGNAPTEVDLVDTWVPLNDLIADLAEGPAPARSITIPTTLVSAGTSVGRYLPPFRDLSDSWLGLTDASRRRGTTAP